MVRENRQFFVVENVDLNKQTDDFLREHGFDRNGQELGSNDARQEYFERFRIHLVPFRGASRLSPN